MRRKLSARRSARHEAPKAPPQGPANPATRRLRMLLGSGAELFIGPLIGPFAGFMLLIGGVFPVVGRCAAAAAAHRERRLGLGRR